MPLDHSGAIRRKNKQSDFKGISELLHATERRPRCGFPSVYRKLLPVVAVDGQTRAAQLHPDTGLHVSAIRFKMNSYFSSNSSFSCLKTFVCIWCIGNKIWVYGSCKSLHLFYLHFARRLWSLCLLIWEDPPTMDRYDRWADVFFHGWRSFKINPHFCVSSVLLSGFSRSLRGRTEKLLALKQTFQLIKYSFNSNVFYSVEQKLKCAGLFPTLTHSDHSWARAQSPDDELAASITFDASWWILFES